MKRILFALTLVGCLLSQTSRAQAATEVSVNFFYDNLSPSGNWIEVGDYGYCFQPNVAVNNPSWRPYADGYWAYTDVGWTWVSYEDFGWATYHYGRWTDLADYGWVWVPGYEWGLGLGLMANWWRITSAGRLYRRLVNTSTKDGRSLVRSMSNSRYRSAFL